MVCFYRLRLLNVKSDDEAAFRSEGELDRLEELRESWSKLNRQLSRRADTMRRRTRNLKHLGKINLVNYWVGVFREEANKTIQKIAQGNKAKGGVFIGLEWRAILFIFVLFGTRHH